MLSLDSMAIMADLINALRATPAPDLRSTLEHIIARRAGVMRVRLRRADADAGAHAAAAAGTAAAKRTADADASATGDATADPAADAAADHEANAEASAAADATNASASAASASAPGPGQGPEPLSIIPVRWRDATFLLDAEPHTRDRAEVIRVLRAAVPVATIVLCAQGHEPAAAVEPQPQLRPILDGDRLVGSSAAMQALRREIHDSASTSFAVLIEGESGVGKELVARQIHACSARRRGPFVPVNCAAVVESLFESELFGIEEGVATGVRARRGKFEQANHGTLFLDEIAELPLPAQAKLLRAVQDFAIERVGSQTARRVDVRLVVATNRSLDALVDSGQFRRDLYFRLRAIQIHVAPLRDRREDIIEIAETYLRRCDPVRPPRLSRTAAGVLCLHHWPGNVRELERALEFALTRCGGQREILPEHLAPDLGQPYRGVLLPSDPGRIDESLTSMKSRYARLKYDQYQGNKRKTCAALDISYHTLIALLKRSASRVNGANVVNGMPANGRPLKGGLAATPPDSRVP